MSLLFHSVSDAACFTCKGGLILQNLINSFLCSKQIMQIHVTFLLPVPKKVRWQSKHYLPLLVMAGGIEHPAMKYNL